MDVAAKDVDEFLGVRPRGEPRSHGDRHRDRGPAHGDDLERRQDREPEPRVPGVQRRLQASGRARRGAGGVRGARLVARRLAGRPHERGRHRQRGIEQGLSHVSIRRSEPEPCSCRSVDAKQLTPNQAMVAKFLVFGETTTASAMAWKLQPVHHVEEPVHRRIPVGRRVAVEAGRGGFEHEKAYLSFQEYFEKLRDEPERWGKPTAARAWCADGAGRPRRRRDRRQGFHVRFVREPRRAPTLISFAVAVGSMKRATSPEFKGAGHRIVRIAPRYLADGLTPDKNALLEAFRWSRSLTYRRITSRWPSPRRATARLPRRCSR